MSEINDMLQDALRERQADNLNPDDSAQFLTWKGEDYPACVGSAKSMATLGIGGFGADANLIAIINISDLIEDFKNVDDFNLGAVLPATPNIPIRKQTVVFNSVKYLIDSTEIPPGLAFIALALIDATKGV
jgi:hypothetical protein